MYVFMEEKDESSNREQGSSYIIHTSNPESQSVQLENAKALSSIVHRESDGNRWAAIRGNQRGGSSIE